jgi:hypothetical protein
MVCGVQTFTHVQSCLLTSRRFVGIFVGILPKPQRDTNMPLTDTKCRNAKGQIKPRKLSDGGGLHLLINPDGAKYWRLAYRGMASNAPLQSASIRPLG